MATLTVALPDTLLSWAEEQAAARGYGSGSDYVRDLIRYDRDAQKLRALLLEGLESEELIVADDACFAALVARANRP